MPTMDILNYDNNVTLLNDSWTAFALANPLANGKIAYERDAAIVTEVDIYNEGYSPSNIFIRPPPTPVLPPAATTSLIPSGGTTVGYVNVAPDVYYGDYTIETYYTPSDVTSLQAIFGHNGTFSGNSATDTWVVYISNGMNRTYWPGYYAGNQPRQDASFTWNIGQRYHVAMCRNGPTTTVYVNGQILLQRTTTVHAVAIGGALTGYGSAPVRGLLEHYHLVKDFAMYSGPFIPA